MTAGSNDYCTAASPGDIAVSADGTVFVSWRQFEFKSSHGDAGFVTGP